MALRAQGASHSEFKLFPGILRSLHKASQHLSSTISAVLTFLEYCACFILQLSIFCAFLYIGIIGQEVPNCNSNSQNRRYAPYSFFIVLDRKLMRHTRNRMPVAAIYAFSDDLLLKMFYHCRLILSDEHETDDSHLE